MTTIKIFGEHDAATRHLHNNLLLALSDFPLKSRVLEVSEPNTIRADGISSTPALMLDGDVVVEGRVPTVDELKTIFENRYLYKSKLYRLRSIVVAVDISQPAENALLFAWRLAQKFEAKVEVIYAMDSIFEGGLPSASGFLSGYKKTVQTELDAFIRTALEKIGVTYEPPTQRPPEPKSGEEVAVPLIKSTVLYGFPEEVIEEQSKKADLIVMGTTGRGNVARNLFGSVSTEVSHISHCPVLFVPGEVEFKGFKEVLYASNFESLDALRIKQAVAFIRRFGGRIHFVHVGPAGEEGLDLERKLFEINYEHSGPEYPFLFSKMVGDDVVEQLNDYAYQNRIDLMVFVTHQRGFWENIMHKSITRKALLGAGLPMLVMHSDSDMLK
ncbi:MAG TPA: universal stress protein [Saprospiraceae bacterium]|nr:universal stress protein [Saprospiraceae bacterium]